jgi:hypothetical protein
MSVSITLNIRLGPLVSLKITGDSCHDLAKALEGYDHLNVKLDALCSDLAERIYPEGVDLKAEPAEDEEEREERQREGRE